VAYPRILVVDDEPQILNLVSRALGTKGYEVVSYDCPIQTLEFVQATPCLDLVMSDVTMPVMSGPALVSRILEVWPQTPVVFMSAHLNRAEVPTDAGFLAKPFGLGDLFTVVDRALTSRNSGTEVHSAHSAGT